MSGEAKPALTLRPMLAQDAPLVAEIFRESISELAADDYGEAQREAWMSSADDESEFAERLLGQLTLIGLVGGSPGGFASLEDNTKVTMLYVHPAAAGQGLGALLLDALEKLAGGRGTARLSADVSDTAFDFFRHRGYEAQSRNSVPLGGEWLANTTMQKTLAAKGPAS